MKQALQKTRGALGCLFFGIFGTLALLLMLFVPVLRWRRGIGRVTAKVALWVGGVSLDVQGVDQLPEGPCVVVANHTSYLDGFILSAALPARFSFVIKKEMRSVPVAGLLLRLIGSEFVDRFNRQKGAMDARRVLRRASQGQSLVFFPEGTFSKEPGLLPFHTGAFATAVRASCPVVPVVIHGARQVLPPDRLILRPGGIEVEILKPLRFASSDGKVAVHLRDEARRIMLEKLIRPSVVTPHP